VSPFLSVRYVTISSRLSQAVHIQELYGGTTMVNQSEYIRAQTTRPFKTTRAMTLAKTISTFGAAAALLLTGFVAPAHAATVYKAPLRTAVSALVVTPEVNAGYDRARYFGDWKDANGDCQNTRHEVLIHETKAALTYSSRACTVTRGKWVTTWDNRVHTCPPPSRSITPFPLLRRGDPGRAPGRRHAALPSTTTSETDAA
jgi:hypothetical protein